MQIETTKTGRFRIRDRHGFFESLPEGTTREQADARLAEIKATHKKPTKAIRVAKASAAMKARPRDPEELAEELIRIMERKRGEERQAIAAQFPDVIVARSYGEMVRVPREADTFTDFYVDTESGTAAEVYGAGGVTIAAACAAFIDEIEGRGTDRKPLSTDRVKKYKRLFQGLADFCAARGIVTLEQFCNAKGAHIRDFRATWKDNPEKSSYYKKNENLVFVFHWFVKQGFIKSNPVGKVEAPDHDDERVTAEKCFTADERRRMLEACNRLAGLWSSAQIRNWPAEKIRAMLLVFMHTGVRISCMADLMPRDFQPAVVGGGFDMSRKAVKNGKRCNVWLPSGVVEALGKVQTSEKGFYFSTGLGEPHSRTNQIDKVLREVCRLAGVKISTKEKREGVLAHKFRHTFISEALSGKVDEHGNVIQPPTSVDDVAEMVGDSPATIRRYYYHFIEAARNRVRAAGRIINASSAFL